jgi:hypothetical protein
MSHLVDIEPSCSAPDAVGTNAARCVDLDFPAVEHLLHRLAETQTAKPPATSSRQPGARKIAALCAVGFVCMSGRATAPETQPIKADRLPRIAALTDANYFNDSIYFDEAKMRDDDDSGEQPVLRGTVEDMVLAVSATEAAPAARPKLRRSTQAALAATPAEAPERATRSPSLLEKLFSVFVPEFSQPPSQRQT